MKTPNFINGFISWTETHYKIVEAITKRIDSDEFRSICAIKYGIEANNSAAYYDLASDLTNEFENETRGRKWNGDWIEVIYTFIDKSFAPLQVLIMNDQPNTCPKCGGRTLPLDKIKGLEIETCHNQHCDNYKLKIAFSK